MDSQDQFERLKAKFQAALEFIESRNLTLQNLNVQDDRLLVRAIAPSREVRDEVMEQFRRLDPSLDNVHPDIRIDGELNVSSTGQSTVQK